MQSSSLHLAIIMDGNGRWALRQGLPRTRGHEAGSAAVRRIVRAAAEQGVGILTLYAFSSDNWRRPRPEVDGLMGLFAEHFRREAAECRRQGIRLTAVGRRDRLPLALRAAIGAAERATRDGRRLWLRIALDYSSRDQLLRAARRMTERGATRERFAAELGAAQHDGRPAPDVDLLIRTGGERRLSDFLLWEAAYAELYFTDTAWPDFDEADLARALADFRARERRYGGLGEGEGHDAAV
ncbi:MAG TPA: polyprenyl diphosphate synthase [Gemmatimonadales bacterium]|nr:polyprenyl diphosphate synthase [Gemmatimonadales bacterium]